ncbi:MAG: hypothetical protein R2932_46250 [Caldilineaceae bacterium]
MHGIFDGVPVPRCAALQHVEQTFAVALLYGVRTFGRYSHDVILVDASQPNQQEVDSFKFYIWRNYGLDCGRYEWNPEFLQYITIAQPLSPLSRHSMLMQD